MTSHILKTLLLFTLLSLCLTDQNVGARPKFPKIFEATYEWEYAGREIKIKSCNVCHDKPTDNKLLSNNYAEALAESLKQKNVMDEDRIRSALKDTEGKPSAVEGKTFGDLIREGRPPASK